MRPINFLQDGLEVDLYYSSHALERMEDRVVVADLVKDSVISCADTILDFPSGTTFVIRDSVGECSCVGIIESAYDISITIITVINNANIFTAPSDRIIERNEEGVKLVA